MKSVITLVLVLLLFTYIHATDATDNIYMIEGIESLPREVQVGFIIEHQFILKNDYHLYCPDWSITTHGEKPAGRYGIDRFGKFSFVPHFKDAGKSFHFKVVVKSYDEIPTEFNFSIYVFDKIPTVIQIEKNWDVYMGRYDELHIYKSVGDIAIKEIDLIFGYDKKGLRVDTVYTDSLLSNGNCTYSVISDSSDSIQLVRIKASTDNPSQADKLGALIGMKIRSLYYEKYECGILPVKFYWTDCKQNFVITEDNDTLYLMVSESKYHSIKEMFESDSMDYFSFDYLSKHPFQLCYQDKDIKSIEHAFFENGELSFFAPCMPDDPGDINLNGIKNEFADADLYSKYFLWGPSVFDVTFDVQMEVSDINNDKIEASPADLVYLVRIITGDALPYAKLKRKGCKIDASFKNHVFLIKTNFSLGAVWVRFKPLGKYEIFNESDMILEYAESDGELKVLLWSGLEQKNLQNSIPAGINNLFRIEGDVELIAVEASDYNGNVMCVDLK